ncbi:MAG: TRAP transporter small permease [Defluviitaleaceae bacterium]|nr:TRAP transporter small permease [Defluviitaleaceae bacterium]
MNILRWLDENIEKCFIVAITTVITVCLFAQVVFRYFLHLPLAWTEEIAIFLLVWLCYFGTSYAVLRRAHLRIDILTNFMKPHMKAIFQIISNACFLVFTIFVLNQLALLTAEIYYRGQNTPVLGMPRWIIYMVVIIAFMLTAFRLVQDSARSVREYKEAKLIQKEKG